MPAPIDLIHRFSDRDLANLQWGPVYIEMTAAAISIAVTTTLLQWKAATAEYPAGVLLFINRVVMRVTAGGLQKPVQMAVRLRNRNNMKEIALIADESDQEDTWVGKVATMSFNCDFIISPERLYLECRGDFSGGTLNNTVFVSLLGYVMPRGSVGYI